MRPKSLPQTLALFAVGYLIWQPVAAWTVSRLTNQPLPFANQRDLLRFLATVFFLGIVAGTLWWIAGQQSRRFVRYFLFSSARGLAFTTPLAAPRFATTPFAAWLGAIFFTAIAMGLLFFWLERWDAGSRSLPVSPNDR